MRILQMMCVVVAAKLALTLWAKRNNIRFNSVSNTFSHTDDNRLFEWSIPNYNPVRAWIEETVHFQMDDPYGTADAEWAALYPGGGIIHLGDDKQPYTVSMLHQLRCLDILRKGAIERVNKGLAHSNKPTDLQHHCVNYLRQMVLCRANTEVEDVVGKPEKIILYQQQCMDWEAVYEAVRLNQAAHALEP